MSAPSAYERRGKNGMYALSACKILNLLDPDNNAAYRAVSALIGSTEQTDLTRYVQTLAAYQEHIFMAWIELERPKRGIMAASVHALDCVLAAVKDDEKANEEVKIAFDLAVAAMADTTIR